MSMRLTALCDAGSSADSLPGSEAISARLGWRLAAPRGRSGSVSLGMRAERGEVKILPCCAWGVVGTRHPQTGAAGIPEAARAFTCVNLLRCSGLDFPCVRPVFVRKRQNRRGRQSRKHVDSTGSALSIGEPWPEGEASGRRMVSRPQRQRQQQHQRAISPFFRWGIVRGAGAESRVCAALR
jgi:hypothetical protein